MAKLQAQSDGSYTEKARKQKKVFDDLEKKIDIREKSEFDGLTMPEMRRKHSIPHSVSHTQILEAYNADKLSTVKKEETVEEIAHQRKVLDQAKMELEWERKERESRRDLEEKRLKQEGLIQKNLRLVELILKLV